MYVHIFGYLGYLVNKLEIWWVYLSPIEKKLTKAKYVTARMAVARTMSRTSLKRLDNQPTTVNCMN